MLESRFKRELKNDLENMFPGCILIDLDPQSIQGIPDLLILYKKSWATLETKKNRTASRRPNQDYYVDLMNEMSFSSFVYPENKEEVLNELQRAFSS